MSKPPDATALPATSVVVPDLVNYPPHYTSAAKCLKCGHPIECIDVIEHLECNVSNAIKYLWRLGRKDDDIQELRKAIWYVQREIDKRLRERLLDMNTPPS